MNEKGLWEIVISTLILALVVAPHPNWYVPAAIAWLGCAFIGSGIGLYLRWNATKVNTNLEQ